MGTFRVWFEAQDRNDRKIRHIYDQVARRFMGETGDVTDQLSKIGKKDVGSKKGAKAAFKILDNMQIFDKLKSFGDEWAQRVNDTQDWLQTGTRIGTVGQLLEKLFGPEHLKYQGYAFKKPDLDKESPPPEEGNAEVPTDSTSPPMSGQQPPPDMAPPEMPPQPPPGMAPPPGMVPPGMPPQPPPGMAPPPGMPPMGM